MGNIHFFNAKCMRTELLITCKQRDCEGNVGLIMFTIGNTTKMITLADDEKQRFSNDSHRLERTF